MNIYERIKNKRNELNMSQDELATKLGYKSRSTIAKIEAGINDIPQSKIQAFADALNTTPGYLMGWDEIENDYKFTTNLSFTYFDSLMNWSEDRLLKKHETIAIRSHMAELFLRYKKVIERLAYTQRQWDDAKDDFSKFYREKPNPLSDREIKELFLKQELEEEINNLASWVKNLPFWISSEENKYFNNEIKSSDKDDNPYLLTDAAHEIEGASDEDKAHDDALMDDDDF